MEFIKNARGVIGKSLSSLSRESLVLVSFVLFTEISMHSGPSRAGFLSFTPDAWPRLHTYTDNGLRSI